MGTLRARSEERHHQLTHTKEEEYSAGPCPPDLETKSSMRLLLDVTRTIDHIYNSTPTGIDRVEHAFLDWLLGDEKPASIEPHFVITAANMHSALNADQMRDTLSTARRLTMSTEHRESQFEALLDFLRQPVAISDENFGAARFHGGTVRQKPTKTRIYATFAKALARGRANFKRLVREASNHQTVYFHTSHTQLEHGHMYRWLEAPNIRSMFFIHDVIPLDYPEFCSPPARKNHIGRMQTVADRADCIIVNSEYTRQRVLHYLTPDRWTAQNIFVSQLGVDLPQIASTEDVFTPDTPYFVCLGTMEGRKNLVHLLNVWRRIFETAGPDRTPRLVFVGKRGWECENVFDVLDRTAELSPYLAEVTGLNDVELVRLLNGASGMVTPSWVEGYSLPPVEAICHGVPVIASDIDAHRELIAGCAQLLDPSDGIAWKDAILDVAWRPEKRDALKLKTKDFVPRSWTTFVADCVHYGT